MGDSEQRLLKPQRLPFSAADPGKTLPPKGGSLRPFHTPPKGLPLLMPYQEGLVLFIHVPDGLQK